MKDAYQNAINDDFGVQDTQGVKINVDDPRERLGEVYTNKDTNWSTGVYSGDLYISTPDQTHNRIIAHANDPDNSQHFLPTEGYPGTSGFFTNEKTAARSFSEDRNFDSIQLGHDLQQAPHFNDELARKCDKEGIDYFPSYNSYLDCFRVNPEKMMEHYGTTDFYAAMSYCTENKQWGDGGGFQGYNHYINDMINKGALEYVPEKSRSCDVNACMDYYDRKAVAQAQATEVNNVIETKRITGSGNERVGYNELGNYAESTNNRDANLTDLGLSADSHPQVNSSSNTQAVSGAMM